MAGEVDRLSQVRARMRPQRAGILAGSTSVGRSFSRGLLARSTADQAVITGCSATLNYALTATSQTMIEAVAGRVADRVSDTAGRAGTQRGLVLVGDTAAFGLGILAQRALAQRHGEPIARAWARTFAWRMATAGAVGAIIVGSESVLDTLAGPRRAWVRNLPVGVALGAGLAARQYHAQRSAMVSQGVTHDAAGEPLTGARGADAARSIAVGSAVTAGLMLAASGERQFARGVANMVTAANPRAQLIAGPIGHLAALGLIAAAGHRGLQEVFHRAKTSGDAIEAAYTSGPTSPHVSGGPASAVALDTIGREGRRFVNRP